MLSFQPADIYGGELDTPLPNRFSADCETSLGKEIFDIEVAEIETIVEPDSIADDVGWGCLA